MTLQDWLKISGTKAAALAAHLQVSRASVYLWIDRKVNPDIDSAIKIIALSEGQIALADLTRKAKRVPVD